MADSLQSPPPVPVIAKPERKRLGPMAGMSPEERTAYAMRMVAARDPNRPRKSTRRGRPKHLTNAQHDAAIDAQRPIVAKVIKKMGQRGELPDEPMAVEALEAALLVLRSPGSATVRTAAASLVLDFTKTKPTTKTESVVKTAEDWVDEMAAKI